ncbi:MAG: helix-turn-helix domain-containing protein [Rickettsiales bacterium]|nr:helix-turn-helix domain-containing protein [Rickettsiales bacterium]
MVSRVKKDDLEICSLVRKTRKLLGISQVFLAKALGITPQQLHKYEAGVDRISASMLQTISCVFKCNIYDLLPKKSFQSVAAVSDNNSQFFNNGKQEEVDDAMKLLKFFFNLGKEEQSRAIALLSEISSLKKEKKY